ncbi:MAG TPA: hypothetical protein VM733_17785 [Thermoanaerobaculia bacterium]|nr:hypothetical protein [Thermoanaerobaculia bacterium]
MKSRVILVCTLLLIAAVPTFARPICADCNEWGYCEQIPGSIEVCHDGPGYCYTTPNLCSPPLAATVATEWKVVSLEISRPSQDSLTVTAPAQRAEIQLPKQEAVAQK